MNIYYRLFLTILLFSFKAGALIDVDFDHSNGLDLMKKYSAQYEEPDSQKKLSMLRKNYERLKPSKITKKHSPIIPKVIHQIWPGNDPIPKNYQYFLETWRKHHPHWQIKIWKEYDLIKENFQTMDLYWRARGYAERADIMRYEVLRRYGGLYIDMDIECFANFDELHYKYDFYTNIEPPAVNKDRVSIVNAMIASIANHPILTQTLVNIRENWDKVESNFEEKYSNNWSHFKRSNHYLAVQRTMYPFADAVFGFLGSELQEKYNSIILPSGYNFPIYFVNETPVINFLSRLFRNKAKLYNEIVLQPETMSFHYYDKNNSLMAKHDFAESLFNSNLIKGLLYKAIHFKDKYFLAFQDLFNKNFPVNLTYQPQPIIPKVIYLENNIYLNKYDLSMLVKEWQILNPGFDVQIIDSKYLKQFVPENLDLSDNIPSIARFYVLNKKGGVYVDALFRPASLQELNYKYCYYGELSTLDALSDAISLNTRIIASIADGSIIRNVLYEYESEKAKGNNLDNNKIDAIYLDKVYKYNQLDGKTMLFPEIYFSQKR